MSQSSLRVEVVPALPRLAWLAVVPHAGGEVRALCGAAVERGDAWLVEGAWDAPFEAGGFPGSDAFFGSGFRIERGRATLAASTAPVDRLLSCDLEGRTVASNSLPLLLAALGSRLEFDHDYWSEMGASKLGTGTPSFPLSAGHRADPRRRVLHQLFHGNRVLEGGESRVELRGGPRSFASYDEYVGTLRATLARIGENLRSPARRAPMSPVALVSAGYDSPAVAALARESMGLSEAFATRPGSGEDAGLEDGAAVAGALGLPSRPLRREPPATGEVEIALLAAALWGCERTLHELVGELARRPEPSLVLSGHHGGMLWDGRSDRPEPPEDVRRGSDDGLALAEARLGSGFVHAAVPFLYARAARDVRRISLSAEMSPWRLGGDYDRPIPRRILEEAGVPRGIFARAKRGIWEATYELPYDAAARERFVAWLDRRLPGAAARLRLFRGLTALDRALIRRLWRLSPRRPPRLPFRLQRLPLAGWSSRHLMFKWANDELAARRERELGDVGDRRAWLGL
jgi:hypothetical protein